MSARKYSVGIVGIVGCTLLLPNRLSSLPKVIMLLESASPDARRPSRVRA